MRREVYGEHQLKFKDNNTEEDNFYRSEGHHWVENEREKVCINCGESKGK